MPHCKHILAVLFALACVAADAADPVVERAMEIAQGRWRAIRSSENGKTIAFRNNRGPVYTVVGDRIQWTIKLEYESTLSATFKLDPTKTPTEIDWYFPTPEDPTYIVKGIYSLKGDTVTMCFGQDGGPRPREFSVKKDGNLLVVLKREPQKP